MQEYTSYYKKLYRIMIKEEQILMEKFGRGKSFRVPEGYFDTVASRVMQSIPETSGMRVAMTENVRQQTAADRAPLSRRLVVWRVAAAIALVAVLSGITFGIVRHNGSGKEATSLSAQAETSHTDYSMFDEAVDYAMIDNQDIYASLLSEGRQ